MEKIIKKGNKAENAIIAISFRLEKQILSFAVYFTRFPNPSINRYPSIVMVMKRNSAARQLQLIIGNE
jgi:hypothetical protein